MENKQEPLFLGSKEYLSKDLLNKCLFERITVNQKITFDLNGFISLDLTKQKYLNPNTYNLGDVLFIPTEITDKDNIKYIPWVVIKKSIEKVSFKSYYRYSEILNYSDFLMYDFKRKLPKQLQEKTIISFLQKSFNEPVYPYLSLVLK